MAEPHQTESPEASSPLSKQDRPKRCLTCAARKVKCDGHRDVCLRCQRLGIECRWQQGNYNFILSIFRLHYMREGRDIQAIGNIHTLSIASCGG